jgi:DNA (cytosine-5)-methyltransferase 1
VDAVVLDARYFVPQSRPRVFVVAAHRSLAIPRQQVSDAGPTGRTRPDTLRQLMSQIRLKTGWLNLELPPPPTVQNSLKKLIAMDAGQEWWDDQEVRRHYRMMHDHHRHRIDELLAKRSRWVGTIFRRVRQGQQRAEVRFDGLAGCLRTPSGGSAKQIVIATRDGKLRMRWMSPREYAALQGVPDFPLVGRTNELLFAFADAVCVPAISWIDKVILTPIFNANSILGRRSDDAMPLRTVLDVARPALASH